MIPCLVLLTLAGAPGQPPRAAFINRTLIAVLAEPDPREAATYGQARAIVGIGSRGSIYVRETPKQVMDAPCVGRGGE